MSKKTFKLVYKDGTVRIVQATNSREVIKQYDLCTIENIDTKIIEQS